MDISEHFIWHLAVIDFLPTDMLLQLHGLCMKIRSEVFPWDDQVQQMPYHKFKYIFMYPYEDFFLYHKCIMQELLARKFCIQHEWLIHNYHGIEHCYSIPNDKYFLKRAAAIKNNKFIYPEHNDVFLRECVNYLKDKNIKLYKNVSLSKILVNLDIKGMSF